MALEQKYTVGVKMVTIQDLSLLMFQWMKEMWTADPCYMLNGVNGSLCSILIYLSEVDSPLCP